MPTFFSESLKLNKMERRKYSRELELEAYSAIISALRSQGELNKEKRNLLTEIRSVLCISLDRHRAEVRRAVSDEELSTVALQTSGFNSVTEWMKEGHRMDLVPPRPLPVTKCLEEADRIAEIAVKENAMPNALFVGRQKSFGRYEDVCSPPISLEQIKKEETGLMSSLYCLKCLLKTKEMIHADTSTDDLHTDEDEEHGTDTLIAPSASDSYVFLPSGTTVKVELGQSKKEEKFDAYSFKSTSSGKLDFASAPEINLNIPHATRRKRKKSVANTFNKETNVTIKQVIRSDKERVNLTEVQVESKKHNEKSMSQPQGIRLHSMKEKSAAKHKLDNDSRISQSQKNKKKRDLSSAVLIQHTPVPPEHLYAVGSRRVKESQPPWCPTSEEARSNIASYQKLAVEKNEQSSPSDNVDHEPSKYFQRSQPRSVLFSNFSFAASQSINVASDSKPNLNKTSNTFFSHRSPSKPFYQSPHIRQSPQAKSLYSKRYRLSSKFSAIKKKVPTTEPYFDETMVKKAGMNAELKQLDMKRFDDWKPSHKVLNSTSYATAGNSDDFTQDIKDSSASSSRQLAAHMSGLKELASVSIMASTFSNSMIETGLAPVSAIVSRVTSPAPGPIQNLPENLSKTATHLSKLVDEEAQAHVPVQPVVTTFHPVSIAQRLNVISTIAGKPRTVLKSAGSVFSVTAKPASGIKSITPVVSGVNLVKAQPGQKTSIIVVHKTPSVKLGKSDSTSTTTVGSDGSTSITVCTKSVTTPSINLPKQLSKSHDDVATSESALGSIQGLVSGLNPTSAVLKTTKFAAVKPKFITTPLQKTAISGKISDTSTKVIKVIGPHGKVQIKASTIGSIPGGTIPNQVIRTYPGSRIVKPIASVLSSSSTLSSPQLGSGNDIVAAALTQSMLGVPTIRSSSFDQGTLVHLSSVTPGIKVSRDSAPSMGIIKVSSSTPAASTIRAFAATYKKNSFTPQQKPILSLSTVQKPLPAISCPQLNLLEKNNVFVSESTGQSKPGQMLFTSHQPQLHRTVDSKSVFSHDAKLSSVTVSHLSPISTTVKSVSKNVPYKIMHQPSTQHMPMQVKVLTSCSSVPQTLAVKQPWRSTSVLGLTDHSIKVLDESAVQSNILQGVVESSKPSQSAADNTPSSQSGNETGSTSERATFIYQYHPSPSLTQTSSSTGSRIISNKSASTSVALTNLERDLITLHSLDSDNSLVKSTAGKQIVQKKPKRSSIVKINLESIFPNEQKTHKKDNHGLGTSPNDSL